jgi:hypothetical protein
MHPSQVTPTEGRGPIGSLSWARETRGRLSPGDRFQLVLQGLRATIVHRPRLWFYKHGLLAGGSLALLDEVPRPTSPAAERALREMERASQGFLAGHCHRTYILGWLLGRVRGLTCDAEMLYVASMFHDLPLTPRYAFRTEKSDCFALDGATLAGTLLEESGWDADKRQTLQQAICLHLNMDVPVALGVEAHLLNAGASCDVTGIGLIELARSDVARVVGEHPRAGFAEGLSTLVAEQARRRPDSRAALLHRLGFRKIMERAPFPAGGERAVSVSA